MTNEITICDIKVPTQREELNAKNKDHRSKIHREILADMVPVVMTAPSYLEDLIVEIANGRIRNLKIIY